MEVDEAVQVGQLQLAVVLHRRGVDVAIPLERGVADARAQRGRDAPGDVGADARCPGAHADAGGLRRSGRRHRGREKDESFHAIS